MPTPPVPSRAKFVSGWGILGLLSGVGYSFVYLWCQNQVNKCTLKIPTEALDPRTTLYALFCSLQQFSNINELAFRRAVEFTDRLLLIEHELYSSNIDPEFQDRPQSYSYYTAAVEYLEVLYTDSKQEDSAKIQVQVHALYLKIFGELRQHWENVLRLTRDVS